MNTRTLPDGTWGYAFNKVTGNLVSEGTVIADPLPPHLELLERVGRADADVERWDEALRVHVPFTDVDKIANIDQQIAALQQEKAKLEGA